MLLLVMGAATYLAYHLNMLGPIMQMSGAAWGQGVELGKQKLRDFVENNETARQAIGVSAPSTRRQGSDISMDTLDSRGRAASRHGAADDGDDI